MFSRKNGRFLSKGKESGLILFLFFCITLLASIQPVAPLKRIGKAPFLTRFRSICLG